MGLVFPIFIITQMSPAWNELLCAKTRKQQNNSTWLCRLRYLFDYTTNQQYINPNISSTKKYKYIEIVFVDDIIMWHYSFIPKHISFTNKNNIIMIIKPMKENPCLSFNTNENNDAKISVKNKTTQKSEVKITQQKN